MARDDAGTKPSNDNKTGAAVAARTIDYALASVADKERMDKLIAAIDDKPGDRNLVREFGKKPMEEIGKAADKAISAQQEYAKAFTIYSGPMKALREGTKEVEGFIRESLTALKTVGGAGVKGAGKGLRWFSKMLKSATSDKEKTDEEKEVEKIEDGLKQQIGTVTKLFNDLEDSVPALKRVDADVKTMGTALRSTNMDLAFYIGAAKEMIRRYDEEIIPIALEAIDDPKSNPVAAEEYHDAVSINRNALQKRMNELQEAQVTGRNSAMRLRNTVENISDQLNDMDFLLSIGRANIKQFVSEAGFTATTLKAAMLQQGIRDAAESILDSQIAVLSKVNEILDRTAKRGGLISHEKLLDSTQKTHQMLEDSAAAKRDRRQLMDAQSKEMDAITNDQADFVKRQRQLQLEEHSVSRQKGDERRASESFNETSEKVETPVPAAAETKPAANQDKPVSEDVSVKQAADAVREARRRAGGGPAGGQK